MSFHFDDNSDIVCDGYKFAETGQFSEQELSEAYVMASRNFIAQKAPEDDELIEAYVNKQLVDGNRRVFNAHKEGLDYEEPEEGPVLVNREELPDFDDHAKAFAGFTTKPGTNERHAVFRKGDAKSTKRETPKFPGSPKFVKGGKPRRSIPKLPPRPLSDLY